MLNAMLISLVVWASPMLDAPYGAGKLPDDIDAYQPTDSLNVRLVGALPSGIAKTVATNNDNIVFLGLEHGVVIFDVSTYTEPRIISEIRWRGDREKIHGLFYKNEMLYIAEGRIGLRILDVSDPSNPQQVGFYDTPGSAMDVFVSGDYAYVADSVRLIILDISDPSNPQEVASYNTPGVVRNVFVDSYNGAVVGSYAYVADGNSGLIIMDVSDPSNPQEVAFYRNRYVNAVFVSGNYAYVAADWAGLRIIDVSDPSNPQEVGYYVTPGWAEDVYVSGNYAYVADRYGGLQIYQFYGQGIDEDNVEPVDEPLKIAVNSMSRFDVSFDVERGAKAELTLYDVAGRRVWRGDYNSGKHHIAKPLPSGIYILKAKIRNDQKELTQTKKLVILR